MADGEVSQSAKTPADFLKSIKGKPVVVKLNSGVDYRGYSPSITSDLSSFPAWNSVIDCGWS